MRLDQGFPVHPVSESRGGPLSRGGGSTGAAGQHFSFLKEDDWFNSHCNVKFETGKEVEFEQGGSVNTYIQRLV